MAKLRRQEAFTLSFDQGYGRETLWLHPSVPLCFTFDGDGSGPVNREWLDALARSADGGDLKVGAEPVPVQAT